MLDKYDKDQRISATQAEVENLTLVGFHLMSATEAGLARITKLENVLASDCQRSRNQIAHSRAVLERLKASPL
jgi:hypothetical protein